MNNLFYLYNNDDLNEKCRNSLERKWNSKDFIMFIIGSDGINNDIIEVQIVAFKNKLDALNYCYNILISLTDLSNSKEFNVYKKAMESAINDIKTTKDDREIDLCKLGSFDLDEVYLNIQHAEYYGGNAKKIIDTILQMLHEYELYLNDDNIEKDLETNNNIGLDKLVEKQNLCRNLLNYKDYYDELFIESFNDLCEFFNNIMELN